MGRPRKDGLIASDSEAPEFNRPNLTHKVVELGEYYLKARELYPNENIRNTALAMIYSENKVKAVIERKGETLFVCEV